MLLLALVWVSCLKVTTSSLPWMTSKCKRCKCLCANNLTIAMCTMRVSPAARLEMGLHIELKDAKAIIGTYKLIYVVDQWWYGKNTIGDWIGHKR